MRILKIRTICLIVWSGIVCSCAKQEILPVTTQKFTPVPKTTLIPTFIPKTDIPTISIPTPSATEKKSELFIKILSVTSPVIKGDNAILIARTIPYADCSITVYYKSGPSKANGQNTKEADSIGQVSWTWKVGTNTTSGEWEIVISANYDGNTVTQSTKFTVR